MPCCGSISLATKNNISLALAVIFLAAIIVDALVALIGVARVTTNPEGGLVTRVGHSVYNNSALLLDLPTGQFSYKQCDGNASPFTFSASDSCRDTSHLLGNCSAASVSRDLALSFILNLVLSLILLVIVIVASVITYLRCDSLLSIEPKWLLVFSVTVFAFGAGIEAIANLGIFNTAWLMRFRTCYLGDNGPAEQGTLQSRGFKIDAVARGPAFPGQEISAGVTTLYGLVFSIAAVWLMCCPPPAEEQCGGADNTESLETAPVNPTKAEQEMVAAPQINSS